jgi:hypothetical protein
MMLPRVVTVAAGPDAAADDGRHVAIFGLEHASPLHRLSVEVVERVLAEVEPGRPIGARTPARGDEFEAGAETAGQFQVGPDIAV